MLLTTDLIHEFEDGSILFLGFGVFALLVERQGQIDAGPKCVRICRAELFRTCRDYFAKYLVFFGRMPFVLENEGHLELNACPLQGVALAISQCGGVAVVLNGPGVLDLFLCATASKFECLDLIALAWRICFPRLVRGTQGEALGFDVIRSEERRVGKECRSRWSPYH